MNKDDTAQPSATQNYFVSDNDLKQFARSFIRERISSLKKDIDHCLNNPFAPFPAILYCFSTIGFMGELANGGPDKDSNEPAKKYMEDFMGYTKEQTRLLMQLFRHKLVHMAMPKSILKNGDKVVSWQYEHENSVKHLVLETAPKDTKVIVKSGWEIPVHQVFTISIRHMVKDIEDSVYGHGGYFDKLQTDKKWRQNFQCAIEEFYKV